MNGHLSHQESNWPEKAGRDQKELAGLFRSQAPRLLRYFRRWRRHADEPTDLVQEVFARVAGPTGLAGVRRPEAYLQRIARNLLLEQRRRDHAEERQHQVGLDEAEGIGLPASQAHELEAADLQRIYDRALASLTERTRRIYRMHREEELSYREIARTLGISESGVEKHMMKAIAHIDRMVTPWL